jgi:UDP-N-acetylglucosamine 4,6-dehydratase
MLDNKKILVTGGTGSLGNALVEKICTEYKPKKLIIFSRCEYKQKMMAEKYDYECLRFFLGDIRDVTRLKEVCRGVDIVIHAAALKQIPTIEYNPTEAVKTNVNGTVNIAETCISSGVERAILISTDKAVNPINLYGATKLCAEKIFLAANSFNKTIFKVVRYGNVLNSRGSVTEFFLKLKEKGEKVFPITHPDMTRFWFTLEEAADLVIESLGNDLPLTIPKIPSMKITDIAKAIEPKCTFEIIGRREGEKMHELLTPSYSSDKNIWWLTEEELRRKIGI